MEMSGFAGTIRSKVGITAMAPANMDSVADEPFEFDETEFNKLVFGKG